MNRMVKGSVAGAAGVALLMGGFGTYATWTDSEDLGDSGKVQSGSLKIKDVGSPEWADVSAQRVSDIWGVDQKMVPGDTVTMTRDIELDAEGKNLRVEFKVDNLSSSAGPGWAGLDIAATYDGEELVPNGDDTAAFSSTGPGSHFSGTKDLVITFSWPEGGTTGTAEQNQSISLENLAVTVTQVRP